MSDRFPWIGMISSGDVDDLRVDILADAIEAAYRAGRSGSDEERSARDLLARLDAAAPVAREDAASPDVAAVAEQYRVLWGYDELNDSCRKAAAQAVQMVTLAAPAQPAEASDVQPAPDACDCHEDPGAVHLTLVSNPNRRSGRVTVGHTRWSAEAAFDTVRAGDDLDAWVPQWVSRDQADLLERIADETRAEASDVQRAAPTREAPLVEAEEKLGGLWCVMATIAGRHTSIYASHDQTHLHAVVRDINAAHVERRVADVGLGVLRGGGADGGGEYEDPNLAHRAAVDTARLSGPDTRSLLLCARDGRVGGAATIGDSRLNASIVWAMLGNGGTPDDVHRSYPWCSVEDAAVLDQLRRDVHLAEDDGEPTQADVDDLRWESRIDRKVGELAEAAGIDRDGLDWESILGCVRVILDALRDKAGATANDLVAPPVSLRVGAAGTPPADIARLARAAGVSPDSEDVVGEIEAAIRAGREPEVVTGAEAIELPCGSRVVRVDENDIPEHCAEVREITPGHTSERQRAQRYLVLHRAPAPTPAPLTVGEVVTGTRAVSAPLGTKLGAKSAAVAAVHTTGGWSVTGMNHEQDHEHAVRINEWVVLALGDGSEA